jgi:hypothetical protein
MQKGKRATLLLGVFLACGVLAAIAAADNPHGTPPGQAQKDNAAATQPAAATAQPAASTASSTPPGQAKKDDAAAANAQPVTADNSTGVKPSSTTQHHTTATAGSNKTKLYGNGKTAGEIAIANGASASTVLVGPGNSQPHKVAVCKNGKAHYVDVHALKSHAAGACPAANASAAASVAASGTTPATAATGTTGNPAPAVATPAPATASTPAAAATVTPAAQAPVTAAVTAPAAKAKVTPAAKAKATLVPAVAGTHIGILGAKKTLAKTSAKRNAQPSHVLAAKAVKHVAAPAKAVVATAHFTG